MSTIFFEILKRSHSPDLTIFQYSYFKIGHVAYKIVAYERKSVYLRQMEVSAKPSFNCGLHGEYLRFTRITIGDYRILVW